MLASMCELGCDVVCFLWFDLDYENIWTLFAGEEDTPIGAMPGCYRLGWRHGLIEEVFICQLCVSYILMHSFNKIPSLPFDWNINPFETSGIVFMFWILNIS